MNRAGKPITSSCLHAILGNRKYIGAYSFGENEVTGGCDAIVDRELFDRVQEMKAKKAHGKGGEKAVNEYLLSGKLFCGMCDARMTGTSSVSKKGVRMGYYQCSGRKRHGNCLKKSEKQGYLEWYVVEQTVEYVLQPERMEYISGRIVTKYNEEFSDRGLKALEAQLAKIDREANAAVDASIAAPANARQIYYDKLELLMSQKAETEHELSVMRMATRRVPTHEQVMKWLGGFVMGEEMEKDFQRRIINVFINSVYIYDEKVIIYYNAKDAKQVSYIEMIDSLDECVDDVPPENTGPDAEYRVLDSVQDPMPFRSAH